MHRNTRYVLLAAALLAAACSDNQLSPSRATDSGSEPRVLAPRFSLVGPPAQCPTVDQSQKTVDSLLPQIFGPGQGRRGKAQGYSNNIEQARRNGNTPLEQAYVDSLINYTLDNYYDGNLIGGQSEATQVRVLNFFYALYCASSIPLVDLGYIFTAENTRLIRNGTPTTTVNGDSAAVQVERGEVPGTIFGTWVSVIRTSDPLTTSLDWYGGDGFKLGAYEFVANPPVDFTSPVLAGVCIQYDDAIVSPDDLRMAHVVPPNSTPTPETDNTILTTAGGTIEIAAFANPAPLGLACDALDPPTSRSIFGRMLQQFAKLVIPARAYAGTSGGSTGGQVRTFSPFAAVDIRLSATGTGPSSPQYIPLNSTTITAPVSVTVTTRKGATPINGIPVSFADGSFTPSSGITDGTGTASSTWTLTGGTNTGTGTPALAPLTFSGSPVSFSVLAIQVMPVVVSISPAPPGGTVGVSYSPFTFAASGGISSFTWTVAAGALPNGLALSTAGVLSGTPTSVGSFTFTVRATSGPVGLQVSGTAEFTIAIATPPVEITTTSLPLAQRGLAYSATLTATGGDNVYGWSIISGALPAGLALSGNTISGTPSAAAVTSTFAVRATSDGKSDTQVLTLTVGSPTAITLSFDVGPAKNRCYAVNAPMTPGIRVKVRDQAGNLLTGVAVNMVAVTNNGSKVEVSPSSVPSIDGYANFGGPTINKTGGYALIISTTTPWPAATTTSGKFTISPSC